MRFSRKAGSELQQMPPVYRVLSKTMKLVIHNYLDLAIEIREAMKIIQYPRVTPSTETLNNYWNPRVSSLMIIILYGSKTSKIIRKCWVSNTKLLIFAPTSATMCCSPHGFVWSFEGWILLRISLGLAVRSFWSDLEKFPKSASGEVLEGSGGSTFWPGGVFGTKDGS